jgi:hypothetical protein
VRSLALALGVAAALAVLGTHWTVAGQATVTPGRSPVTKDEIGDEVQTVPRGRLPVFADEGDTGALYRFATTRGDVLRYVPCTCGCTQVGHTSNRSCYVKAESDATVTHTSHAAT